VPHLATPSRDRARSVIGPDLGRAQSRLIVTKVRAAPRPSGAAGTAGTSAITALAGPGRQRSTNRSRDADGWIMVLGLGQESAQPSASLPPGVPVRLR
jgi:hypothetical protein